MTELGFLSAATVRFRRGCMVVAVLLAGMIATPDARQATSVYSWATLAGRAVASEDGAAAAAVFGQPAGIVALPDGAVLVADRDASAIRRVATDGAVTTYAGRLETPGWADGAVANARFTRPFALARTAGGDLWVGEEILFTGTRIRYVTAVGGVSTIVQFGSTLRGMAAATNGDLLASFGGASIIRVTAAGTQTTVVVSGVTSVQALATHPTLGLVAVVRSGQTGPPRLVALTELGGVTNIAGATTGVGTVVDGVGAAAQFASVTALSSDASGRVYLLDSSRVRTVDLDGTVTTVAGPTGFSTPSGIAVRSDGQIAIADTFNRVMRLMTPSAVVSTWSGTAGAVVARDGTGADARFARAAGIDVLPNGDLLVADLEAHAIRRVTPTGVVTTFAGELNVGGFADGTGTTAKFNFPIDVAVAPDGRVFVADYGNHAIRVIAVNGAVTTLAGPQPGPTFTPGTGSGYVDGAGADARLNLPTAIALAPSGDLYIADYLNTAIRVLRTDGTVATVRRGAAEPSQPAFRQYPTGIAFAPEGYLVVTEEELVRRVNLDGSTSVIAGSGQGLYAGLSNVDGTGTAARFKRPAGVSVDSGGVSYVADDVKVRQLTTTGVVTTLGGATILTPSSPTRAVRLDVNGIGDLSSFSEAWGLARLVDGRLVVAERSRIRIGSSTTGTGPAITVEPADVTVASGSSATVTLTATGTPAPEYVLERRVQRTLGFPNVIPVPVWEPVLQPNGGYWTTTASLSTLPVTSVDSGSLFRVVVSNGYGQVVSRELTLGVSGPPLVSAIAGDRTLRVGQSRTLSTTVSGGSPAPSLQWQSSADGVSGWVAMTDSSSYTGTTTATLSILSAPLSLDGVYLRVVATNTHGTATTDPVQVTINPLGFTQQPADASARSGQTVTFTTAVDAYGSAPTYQWQYLSGSTWMAFVDNATVAGAQTSSLTLSQVAQNLSVRVVASANGGSRTSRTAALAVVDASLSVSPTSLAFATRRAAGGGLEFPERQSVLVGTSGPSRFEWLVSSQPAWITSGKAQDGRLNVLLNVTFDYSGVSELSGTIVLVGSPAGVTASIPVTVTIRPESTNALPFGNLDTPAMGATGLAGAVAVTGWALDDIGVRRVEIWRDCIEAIDRSRGACRATPNGDADAVYVGDVLFVSGARPDVASQFSAFPQANRAGWGLMVLTNMLPHIPNGAAVGGQGTFLLSAYAIDTAGQAAVLGRSSVTLDNDNSQLPFGAIDAPPSGGLLANEQVFLGWGIGAGNRCLSSFRMYIDGVEITTANGLYTALRAHRPDVDPLFPSSCPTQQKGLNFYLTGFAIPNGRHTVSYEATDTLGNTGQFGSRFFDVLAPIITADAAPAVSSDAAAARAVDARPAGRRVVRARVGSDDVPAETVTRGDDGLYRVTLPVGRRLRLDLDGAVQDAMQVVDGARASLPAGSTFDAVTGLFAWEPPIGYFGPFTLEFEINGEWLRVIVMIVESHPASVF